jgi:ketosteroid isomerase-like protein
MVDLVRKMVESRDGGMFAELFAEDGVLEYPFAAPGFPTVLKGQTQIRELIARMREMRNVFEIHEISAVAYETTDPELVIAEITHSGHSHATNRPYTNTAVGFIRVRDGKIVHYKDYMNPIAAAEFLGRLPAMLEALSGTGAAR